jgi:hypothetical protein
MVDDEQRNPQPSPAEFDIMTAVAWPRSWESRPSAHEVQGIVDPTSPESRGELAIDEFGRLVRDGKPVDESRLQATTDAAPVRRVDPRSSSSPAIRRSHSILRWWAIGLTLTVVVRGIVIVRTANRPVTAPSEIGRRATASTFATTAGIDDRTLLSLTLGAGLAATLAVAAWFLWLASRQRSGPWVYTAAIGAASFDVVARLALIVSSRLGITDVVTIAYQASAVMWFAQARSEVATRVRSPGSR